MMRENAVLEGAFLITALLAMVACGGTIEVNDTYRRHSMINLNQLGIGGIIFLIGAVIYIINLLYALGKRTKAVPIDGVGLMVLGLGLALLLKL